MSVFEISPLVNGKGLRLMVADRRGARHVPLGGAGARAPVLAGVRLLTDAIVAVRAAKGLGQARHRAGL